MRYIPSSAGDRQAMLRTIGVPGIEDLFGGIPDQLRLKRLLDVPPAMSEPELLDYFRALSNRNATDFVSFLGGGVYQHYTPLIIDSLISRSEFFTAYTPYQAELAQGTLQAVFEFQTYICQLTGMDVANASLYDGSTGLAEAVLMAQRLTKKNRILMADSVHPEYRAVVSTYARNLGLKIDPIPATGTGQLDMDVVDRQEAGSVAAVVVQSPNFFGMIENVQEVSAAAHGKGALSIVCIAEAMSLGLLKPPGEAPSDDRRADIVVGDVQSLGVPMSFGGPHVGFLATRDAFLRQMPGRLVGMGKDFAGNRAFVLTLSTREQHIRRDKATSNICTNQSLCALMTTIYLSTVGPAGLREIAERNVRHAAYAASEIQKRTNHRVIHSGPRFNEFVVEVVDGVDTRLAKLRQQKVLGGLPLARFYPDLKNHLLITATEVHNREQIDRLVGGLQ